MALELMLRFFERDMDGGRRVNGRQIDLAEGLEPVAAPDGEGIKEGYILEAERFGKNSSLTCYAELAFPLAEKIEIDVLESLKNTDYGLDWWEKLQKRYESRRGPFALKLEQLDVKFNSITKPLALKYWITPEDWDLEKGIHNLYSYSPPKAVLISLPKSAVLANVILSAKGKKYGSDGSTEEFSEKLDYFQQTAVGSKKIGREDFWRLTLYDLDEVANKIKTSGDFDEQEITQLKSQMYWNYRRRDFPKYGGILLGSLEEDNFVQYEGDFDPIFPINHSVGFCWNVALRNIRTENPMFIEMSVK